jgi:hypothetical protein
MSERQLVLGVFPDEFAADNAAVACCEVLALAALPQTARLSPL